MLNLGVNVDHVATVRQARLADRPSPLAAALLCEKAGAWGITAHLREDRRHIQDRDLRDLNARVRRLNMEMAVTDEMVSIAGELRPHSCCLVPEKRAELTTEGGLDVAGGFDRVTAAVRALKRNGILVSLFIDPDLQQIQAAADSGADYIEMHTGSYANAAASSRAAELDRLKAAAAAAAAARRRALLARARERVAARQQHARDDRRQRRRHRRPRLARARVPHPRRLRPRHLLQLRRQRVLHLHSLHITLGLHTLFHSKKGGFGVGVLWGVVNKTGVCFIIWGEKK